MKRQSLYFRINAIAFLLILSAFRLGAQETLYDRGVKRYDESENINASKGSMVVIKLTNSGANSYYAVKEYDESLLEYVKTELSAKSSIVIFNALKPGRAELVLHRIVDRRVMKKYLYVININDGEGEDTKNKEKKKKEEKKAPSEEERLYSVARSLLASQSYEKAGEIFRDIADKYPASEYGGKSMARLADISFLQSNYSKAADRYKNVLASVSAPTAEMARANYMHGVSLLNGGSAEKALSSFLRTQTFFPDSTFAVPAIYRAAKIMNEAKQNKEAVALLEFAVTNYSNSYTLNGVDYMPKSVYLLARVLETGGKAVRDLFKAYDYYNIYATRYPEAADIEAVLKRRRHLDRNFINIR